MLSECLDHLNNQTLDIKSPMEVEENGTSLFLNVLRHTVKS